MNYYLAITLIGFLAVAAFPFLRSARRFGIANTVTLWVESLTTHHGMYERNAEVALAAKCLLVYKGTADPVNGVILNIATTKPLGVTDESTYDIGDPATVLMLGGNRTRKMVASAAIAVGGAVYSAAAGKVQPTPTGTGVVWLIGSALTAALADGDYLEVRTHEPIPVIVIVEPTCVGASAGANDATTVATLAKTVVDITALRTALATPALVQML